MKTATTLILLLCASTVSAVPISGLVGYWPADDGTANDQSVNNNDGTFLNGATTSSVGVVGQAFSFDGINDFVSVDTGASIADLQQLTLAAWVSHNSLPPGQIERYVTLVPFPDSAVLRHDGENGPQQLHFFMEIDGSFRHLRVNSVLQTGVFHHVAGTYDGSVMRLFLDGIEIDNLAVNGAVTTGSGVRFSSPDESLDGLLDEIRIYDRALSPSEIQELAAVPEPSTSLLAAFGIVGLFGLRRRC